MLSGLFYLKWGGSQYFHKRTWISHSNATKCMKYNYAKCTCFFFLCGYIIHLCEGIVLGYELFNFIIQWNIAELEWKQKTALTKHSASRHRFSVQPEGNLRQDDGHDAREVGLNHKIANFPFQMEICCHHYIFAWAGGGETERDRQGQRNKSWNIQGKKRSSSNGNVWKHC